MNLHICYLLPLVLVVGIGVLVVMDAILNRSVLLLLLIAEETHREIKELTRRVVKLTMNLQELQVALGALGDQLSKALAEIEAEIQALGTVPQEVVDALDRAKAVAQSLDDLNPDA